VANAAIHPKEAKQKRVEAKEKAKDEEEANHALESKQDKPNDKHSEMDDAKSIALRKRVEKVKKEEEEEEEDQQWKSSAQWRWEVITGRHRQPRKEGEQKWKDAMEPKEASKTTKETTASKGTDDDIAGSNDHNSGTSDSNPSPASVVKSTSKSTSNTTPESDNTSTSGTKEKNQTLAKKIVHAEPPNNFRAGESKHEIPSDMMLRESEFAQKQGQMQGQGHLQDERQGQKQEGEGSDQQQSHQQGQQEVHPGTPEEQPPAYEEGGATRHVVEALAKN
jgi:hypothetical protein